MSIDEDRIISLKYEVAKLKEELETVNDKLGNELQVKYLEIEQLKEDIENGTSHLERLLFKYDKVREEWGQLKYTLDEIKELVRERRRNGEIELAEIFETILAKHEDKK